MASVRESRIKTAMWENRKAYGYNLVFPSPWVVEILGYLRTAGGEGPVLPGRQSQQARGSPARRQVGNR